MDADWELVRTLLAVVDAASLAGAARELGVVQPTVGRHIDELEAQLGLVRRRTDAGVSMAPRNGRPKPRTIRCRSDCSGRRSA